MKKIFYCIVFAGSLVSFSSVSAQVFARKLSLGMRGEDVRMLQVILNSDPDTRVGASGPGSPGEETTYFGFRTKQAVVAFQEKYKEKVLSPLGLTKGTGYVGTFTRKQLNVVQKLIQVRDETRPTTSSLVFSEQTSTPQPTIGSSSLVSISSLSPTSGPPGTEVTITGTGFRSSGNIIYTGYGTVEDVSSPDGKTLKFILNPPLPGSLNQRAKDALSGKISYMIYVSNENGISEKEDIHAFTLQF